ncbi:hypothetical protein [Pseudocolwellia agarivorans]|uniref:hypothetical protein n=1 Tax=Pseudocolwellia agarivorans TaxID=1911682 RepID=UPI0009866296|nr:hypothetical protein [Pseudocolwellia agarivorans]
MKLKPLLLTTLISSTILAAPLTAVASETNLKVAVIKDAAASESILNGEYKEVIANLSNKSQDFEESTTLCVAYLKSDNEEMSETACTAAIRSAKKLDASSKKMRYLQSISYNNRAVARYLKDDMSGAMSDLALAKSLDNNPLVQENLSLINSKVELADDTNYSTYAD